MKGSNAYLHPIFFHQHFSRLNANTMYSITQHTSPNQEVVFQKLKGTSQLLYYCCSPSFSCCCQWEWMWLAQLLMPEPKQAALSAYYCGLATFFQELDWKIWNWIKLCSLPVCFPSTQNIYQPSKMSPQTYTIRKKMTPAGHTTENPILLRIT